jgi:putative transposase
MSQKLKKTPPRLPQVFQKYAPPLYLVTICTLERRAILANPEVHESFREFGERGQEFLIGVGRYVIMPDHLHAFVRIGGDVSLSRWVKGLKRTLDKTLESSGHTATTIPGCLINSFWQPGSFDHLLRHSESYADKWHYVAMNPVRAGLVSSPGDWPFRGEIVLIDRA